MPEHNLPLSVVFEEFAPPQIPARLWQPLWEIHSRAFSQVLANSRTPAEIETYVGDTEHFRQITLDPQSLVGNRHNPDQTYKRPTLIVAYDSRQPIGFIKLADNVSGATEQSRQRKEQTRWKNYRAAMELAIDPDWQDRGIGLMLAAKGLLTAKHLQRGAAYTFPVEMPLADAFVRKIGGQPTGQPLPITRYFGEDRAPVMQQRYVFTTARWIGHRLLRQF